MDEEGGRGASQSEQMLSEKDSYFLTLFTIRLSPRSGHFDVGKWGYLFLHNAYFLVLS